MTAGLPKSVGILCLSLAAFTAAVLAQDTQSPPLVIDPVLDVQTESTVMDEILPVIENLLLVTDEQKASLLALFAEAASLERLDAATALSMLDLVGWTTLSTAEEIAQALAFLQGTLSTLIADETVDPLAYITGLLNAALTPAGVTNAITNAGASEGILAAAQDLIASGIPPGILVRVTKDLIREGASDEEIAQRLAILEAAYTDGASAGQSANEAVEQGSFQYEEQEEEQNTVEGEPEEPQEEANANGSRNDHENSGKKPDKKK